MLLLPDGQDPDEFARSHGADEFKQFIADHQMDFIQFKTQLLLRGETDPTKRAAAVSSIVESISVIQNQILRDTYIHDCAQRIGMSETTLINQMNAFIRARRTGSTAQVQQGAPVGPRHEPVRQNVMMQVPTAGQQATKVEQMLLQLVIRHGGHVILENVEDDAGQLHNITVAQFVKLNLEQDELNFNNEVYRRILDEAAAHSGEEGFDAETYFLHHEDFNVSQLAARLVAEEYRLVPQKVDEPLNDEAERQRKANETDALRNQTNHLLLDFRMDIVEGRLKQLQAQLAQAVGDNEKLARLMADYRDLQVIRNSIAKQLGNNIIL